MKNNNLIKHFMQIAIQGLFGLLPVVIIMVLILWLYGKINLLVDFIFKTVGFKPENNEFLWLMLVIIVFLLILYFIGHLVKTRLAGFFESLLKKVPGYPTIKEIISIFNSSKEGDQKVLVVAIKGFAIEGYNIGLMYSRKESIIKEHYTVTLSMSPIPNGGYMFEVHKENIFVIENATFDDNLQYLLSMGVKSFSDIIKTEPKHIDELIPFSEWLELTHKK